MKKIIKQRMCVGCRTVKNKDELLRIVKGSDEQIRLDLTRKYAGRGAYICNNLECLKIAAKKKQFDRAFKTKIGNYIYNILQRHITEMSEMKNKNE